MKTLARLPLVLPPAARLPACRNDDEDAPPPGEPVFVEATGILDEAFGTDRTR